MVTVHDFTARHGIGAQNAQARTTAGRMVRGRGARSNVTGRFENHKRLVFDDGWQTLEDEPALRTEVVEEQAKKLINK
ncbi:MAG: hypothetical protein AAF441_29040, partial [Pseudomonadota bacterium]